MVSRLCLCNCALAASNGIILSTAKGQSFTNRKASLYKDQGEQVGQLPEHRVCQGRRTSAQETRVVLTDSTLLHLYHNKRCSIRMTVDMYLHVLQPNVFYFSSFVLDCLFRKTGPGSDRNCGDSELRRLG